MKKTIEEKALAAINALNWSAVVMHRQMKSGELNQTAADKEITKAQRKAKAFKKLFFARTSKPEDFSHIQAFCGSDLEAEYKEASERFGKVLKHYAKAVGARFEENKNRR